MKISELTIESKVLILTKTELLNIGFTEEQIEFARENEEVLENKWGWFVISKYLSTSSIPPKENIKVPRS